MTQLIMPKEYKKLLNDKKKADKELRWFLIKKPLYFKLGNTLVDIAELGIKGGPKDLSTNLDSYLYAWKRSLMQIFL